MARFRSNWSGCLAVFSKLAEDSWLIFNHFNAQSLYLQLLKRKFSSKIDMLLVFEFLLQSDMKKLRLMCRRSIFLVWSCNKNSNSNNMSIFEEMIKNQPAIVNQFGENSQTTGPIWSKLGQTLTFLYSKPWKIMNKLIISCNRLGFYLLKSKNWSAISWMALEK